MQATMQINSPLLSLQGNLSLFGGNTQAQRSSAPGSIGGNVQTQYSAAQGLNGMGSQPSQMSHTTGVFSKTSYAFLGQNFGNNQSSTCVGRSTTISRIDTSKMINNRSSSSNDCGCHNSSQSNQTQWSNTAVSGNKASIDLGDYKLDLNKSDSSMTMTNTKTGDKTKIWGDPHLTQHMTGAESNSSTAMFNGPMTFTLPDNTKVTVGTQQDAGNKSISYADTVTITKGNQAYQVSGLSQQDKSGLSVQKSNDGRALDNATPDGFTLQAARDGSGWINPATGQAPTPDDIRKANT